MQIKKNSGVFSTKWWETWCNFLKLEGCSPGVPDLCVPIPNKKYHGLFIEMKYGKNKPTAYQKEWIEYLNGVGYLAVVCYGADEALDILKKYITDKA